MELWNMLPKLVLPSFALLSLVACANDDRSRITEVPLGARMIATAVATGLNAPVHVSAPSGDGRLFIVEQGGIVRVVTGGALLPTPFLDISAKISTGAERGLFSIAFDPGFAQNRRFFLNYTATDGATTVERYLATAGNPDVADPASASLVIRIEQPYANHNGGHILFGSDNMLYIAMGDGGGPSDPDGHAQNRNTLLGALLRIDVSGGQGYTVPADNPFVSTTNARPEIWAYGLRNPWRIAIDAPTSRIYIADVGENAMEEVNVENLSTKGLNYGWSIMEGTLCHDAATCDRTGLTLPKHTYGHSDQRCSITGGPVYRGTAMRPLQGHYFYADFCESRVRSFVVGTSTGLVAEHRDWDIGNIGNITSFGTDGANEMYVVSIAGSVYRLAFAP